MKSPIHILGAGPAGLCAAIGLARAGRDVHLHERYDVAGKRFQGDLQGLENWTQAENVLEELRSFGIETNFTATPFREVVLTDGKNSFSRNSSEPIFYLVKRGPFPDSLDSGLAKQALEAGVKIQYQSRWPAEQSDIIATGPLRQALAAADKGYIFPIDHPNIAVGIFHDELAFKGYSYFLVDNGYGCLCTVVFNDFHRLNACFEKTFKIAQRLYNIKMDHARPVGGIGGFSLNYPKKMGDSCIVGEAGGFQDFLWGFGIRLALNSGHLAAQSVLYGKDYVKTVDEKLTPFLKAGIVNRYLWETMKFNSKPIIPMMMRLPMPLRSSFKFLYRYSAFHRLLYPFAERYVKKHYSNSIDFMNKTLITTL